VQDRDIYHYQVIRKVYIPPPPPINMETTDVKCHKCPHCWTTVSVAMFVTCPSCQTKTLRVKGDAE